MPFTLGLPRALCRTLTIRAHARRPRNTISARQDPAEYFRRQYRTSPGMRQRYMPGLDFTDKRVLDIGGGLGGRVPYWLDAGAREVWCIDINRKELDLGRKILTREFPQYQERARFLHPDDCPAAIAGDLGLLVDAFEHLQDPAAVLDQCAAMLRPGGELWIGSIGWYNYMASHCIGHIPIPWCQVLFRDAAIIATIRELLRHPAYRPNYWELHEGIDRWDRATSLRDRPGEPLNQLSLRAVRRVLRHPAFEVREFRLHPIGTGRTLGHALAPLLHVPGLDELLHGYYTATLTRKATP